MAIYCMGCRGLFEENEALKQLLAGKDELLVAYRTGYRVKESTFKKIEKAKKVLKERGCEVG